MIEHLVRQTQDMVDMCAELDCTAVSMVGVGCYNLMNMVNEVYALGAVTMWDVMAN